jgi:hypothetical protein
MYALDVPMAMDMMDLIIAQGEGTTTSPSDEKGIAHYYRFEQVVKRLAVKPDNVSSVGFRWVRSQSPSPLRAFGRLWITPHPPLVSPTSLARMRADLFNRSYSDLLDSLHNASTERRIP